MQLVVLSGKGGTGKTTVAASLSLLSRNSIKVDCDVDAPNLSIVLGGEELEQAPFYGGKKAQILTDSCIRCGACEKACRYNAITAFAVNELKCEGCAACTVACKQKAIVMADERTATTYITRTADGILSRTDMEIGAEGSGRLVTEVRKNAARYYEKDSVIILDGPPGIGCAVMASVTGCDAALLVVEPTMSGLEDFLRVLSVCCFFGVKVYVCINKYDINIRVTEDIKKLCNEKGLPVMGEIPFDDTVQRAVNERRPVMDYPYCKAAKEIKKMWYRISVEIKEE